MHKEEMEIGGLTIEIIRKSNLKNLYIRVNPPEGDVTVSSPLELKNEDIRLFVLRKLSEITKVRDRMLAQERQSKREYVSGESHYLWGRPYRLQVIYEGKQQRIVKTPTKIVMTVQEGTSTDAREKLFIGWYRQELSRVLDTPVECLEYVVVHELVHLVEKNHTHRFHALVEQYYPTWREAKKLLAIMPLDYMEKGESDIDDEETDIERYL